MKAKAKQARASSSRWQLQIAKARFSEVFRRARSEGPQYVTRAGKETVVIVSAEEFERLRARHRQPKTLFEFFQQSPLRDVNLDLERDLDVGRDIEL